MMISRVLLTALLVCGTSIAAAAFTYSPLANTATCQPNYNLNWVSGNTGGSLIATDLQYPLCAADNHHGPSTTGYTYLYGGYDGTTEMNLYATTDGFKTLAYPSISQTSVGPHRMGTGAVTNNGTVIFVGGETGTTAATADAKVYYSIDHGRTFSVAGTAPFKRYEGQMLSMPYTNKLVLIGGYDQTGAQTNDIWLSEDGIGAVWNKQNPNGGPLPTNAIAGSVVLYDSKYVNPSLYSTPNSTILFFLEYSNGAYWTTYDLGRTWTQSWIYPFATASSSVGHRNWLSATADLDNYIYFTGLYNVPDPSVWISMTKGQTWALLTQSMSIPGVSSTLMYYWSKYGCMSSGYNATTLAKQIYLYGYQQIMSDGVVYQSLIGDLNVPNGQVGYGTLPNATIATSAPVTQLQAVAWPACSYNIHSLTSSPSFYKFGGQVAGTTTGSTTGYQSTDGLTFTQTSATALPTNLMNAASVRLNNGNILVMGGQPTTTASGYSSVVYVSTDNGVTFTQSSSAAFGTRTNMMSCAAPGTNTVVVIGGYITATTATNNVFISIDGRGATWQQIGTLPVVTAAGSCVFLYDSSSVSSTYTSPNSTLLVFTHTGRLYRSYNLGASFDANPSRVKPGPSGYQFLPFSTQFDATSTRYHIRVVADYDNHLYATGGLNIYDNGVYFSGDLGFTWYRIKQTNSLNSGNYIMASTSCLAMSYTQSGSSYTKRLSLYGGLSVQFDNASNYSAIAFSLDDTPSFIPAVTGTAISTEVMAAQANNAQLWCSYNSSMASVQWTSVTPTTLIPELQWPSCGKDVHHFADRNTSLFMYGGTNTTTNNTNRLYATNDGFKTLLPASHADTAIGTRRMGSMAVMPNGDILHLGGQTGATADSAGNDVYISRNGGASFTLVNNTFPRRYETQLVQVPNTNNLVMVGGYTEAGNQTNEIWLSTDGQGAIWTLQASASPLPNNAVAGAIALHDSVYCNPALYSSPNSTLLFFLEYSLGDYWMSYDLGRTWTVFYVYPFSTGLTSASQVTHRDWMLFAADLDNYIYHFGMYNNPDQTMWISRNKGQYWEAMAISPSTIPGTSAYSYIMWSQYGCGGMQYTTNRTTGQRQKQFAAWGYQNWLTDGTTYSAAVANLLNVPNIQGYPYAPNATLQTSLPTNAIPNGRLPACAYNVHARNGTMMAMGGQSIFGNVSSGHSIFTASTSSFASATTNRVTIDVSSTVAPVSGAGLAFLTNGNILYFGGQNVDGTYSNNVYLSSSTAGIQFTAVGTAPWQGRSNFITCTMPNSNTVVVIGGQSSSSLADFWVSTDGHGATWTRRTNIPWSASLAVQAGSCVFLHDVSNTQPNPTLLVFLHTNVYYRSLDGGLTWLTQPDVRLAEAPAYHTAPWSAQFDNSKVRYGIEVVADFDNHLYAMAGTDHWDNTMWWSGDKGFTWFRMKQINTLNSAYFIQASTSCLGINYRQDATSGTNWNKTLVLYGGQIQFDDRSTVGAMQIVLDNPVVVVPSDAATFNLQPVGQSLASSSTASAGSSSTTAQRSSSSSSTVVVDSSSSSLSAEASSRSPSSSSSATATQSSSTSSRSSSSSSATAAQSSSAAGNSSSSSTGGVPPENINGSSSLGGGLVAASLVFLSALVLVV